MRGSPPGRGHVSSRGLVQSVLSGPPGGLQEGLVGQSPGRPPGGASGALAGGSRPAGVRRLTPAEALTKLNCAHQRLFSIFIVGKSHFKDLSYLEAKLFFLSVECRFFTMTS